ncbi:interleukin-17D [Protopterus annectens]|uniref:interleukin-17D n=1 Tax=Protopterus annectens TaxID=7888 RepID=UPI001CFA7708|nr:interleukin-17D [Protopterus annectens]
MVPAALVIFVIVSRTEGVHASQRLRRNKACMDLPEQVLEQMFGRLTTGMMSAFHHALHLTPMEKENRTCPSGRNPTTEKAFRLPTNLLSISPWTYSISYDSTRYPKYIPEAHCLCKGCLTGLHGDESLQFRSIPVYMPIAVLRRTSACAGGRYVYSEDYVTIPVGCTCVPEQEKEMDGYNSSTTKEEIKSTLNKT